MEFGLFYSSVRKRIFLVFVFFLVAGSIFFTSEGFVDPETAPKRFWFYGITALASLVVFIRQVKLRIFPDFTGMDLVIVLAFFYLFIHSFVSGNADKESALQLTSFLLLYFTFKTIRLKKYFTALNTLILLLCVAEALLGLSQYAGISGNPYPAYKITGSFDNPAGFAITLVLAVPLCFYLYEDQRKSLRYVAVISFVVLVAAVVLSESRSGIISVAVVTVFYVWFKWSSRYPLFHGRIIGILLVVLVTGLTFFLYKMKKDSADGRILVWNISQSLIKEKPWTGQGVNTFVVEYMPEQANYFRENKSSPYTLLADNVKHPFNEYFLFVIERGLAGFFFLLLLAYFLIAHFRKDKSITSLVSISVLLSVAVFSLFSYPMKYPFCRIMICLYTAVISQREPVVKKASFALCYFFLLLAAGNVFLTVTGCYSEHRWNLIARKSLQGMTRQMIPEYEKLYRPMKDNGLFLYNYAAELHHIREYEKSLRVMEECEKRFNDYDVQLLKAENYLKLRKYKEAERYFIGASEMCPVRFIPYYNLMVLYELTGEEEKRTNMAEFILEKPVKIPSATVAAIRRKAQNILN